jgi:hypothetical protein
MMTSARQHWPKVWPEVASANFSTVGLSQHAHLPFRKCSCRNMKMEDWLVVFMGCLIGAGSRVRYLHQMFRFCPQ